MMQHRLSAVAVAVVVVGFIVASCGGNVVVDGYEPFDGSWDAYCDARASICDMSAAACKGQEICAKTILRDEIEGTLWGCLVVNCNQDACFSAIRQQFPTTARGAQFVASHASYLASCPDGNNDIAIAGWIADDSLLDEFQACMNGSPCAEVTACFSQVENARIDPCRSWF